MLLYGLHPLNYFASYRMRYVNVPHLNVHFTSVIQMAGPGIFHHRNSGSMGAMKWGQFLPIQNQQEGNLWKM